MEDSRDFRHRHCLLLLFSYTNYPQGGILLTAQTDIFLLGATFLLGRVLFTSVIKLNYTVSSQTLLLQIDRLINCINFLLVYCNMELMELLTGCLETLK